MTLWATFDCYGTLIDWRGGLRAEFARVYDIELPPEVEEVVEGDTDTDIADADIDDGAAPEVDAEPVDDEAAAAIAEASATLDALVDRYLVLEREIQQEGYRPYREVMTEVMRRMDAPAGEETALADALAHWAPFPEVPGELAAIKERGWKIAILSNCDSDQIAASVALLGVDFDEIVVAEEVRYYKPALAHWTEFYVRTLADKYRHVHVGASLYHDIAPAVRLRLPTVWINRLDEHPNPQPTVNLPDFEGTADALDSIFS